MRFYHAGSLNPEYSSKNTHLVLQAFDMFLRKDKPNATLTVSGVIKDFKSQGIINKHNNISTIDGIVDRKTVSDLYKSHHCVLMPSSREGLGLSLYEAQACGCSVVTTDLPPMNECSTQYLCAVDTIRKDEKLIPLAILNYKNIYEQIKRAYGDIACQKYT